MVCWLNSWILSFQFPNIRPNKKIRIRIDIYISGSKPYYISTFFLSKRNLNLYALLEHFWMRLQWTKTKVHWKINIMFSYLKFTACRLRFLYLSFSFGYESSTWYYRNHNLNWQKKLKDSFSSSSRLAFHTT